MRRRRGERVRSSRVVGFVCFLLLAFVSLRLFRFVVVFRSQVLVSQVSRFGLRWSRSSIAITIPSHRLRLHPHLPPTLPPTITRRSLVFLSFRFALVLPFVRFSVASLPAFCFFSSFLLPLGPSLPQPSSQLSDLLLLISSLPSFRLSLFSLGNLSFHSFFHSFRFRFRFVFNTQVFVLCTSRQSCTYFSFSFRTHFLLGVASLFF